MEEVFVERPSLVAFGRGGDGIENSAVVNGGHLHNLDRFRILEEIAKCWCRIIGKSGDADSG